MKKQKIRKLLKNIKDKILLLSLSSACKEQNYTNLIKQLNKIVPDISNQYTSFKLDEKYLLKKTRLQHAFQISLAIEAVKMLKKCTSKFTIVDIGDSAGTHLKYLEGFFGNKINAISVNLDIQAIKKIKQKGLNAIHSRAELLHKHPDFSGNIDLFLSYEMLEHMLDPIGFLRTMANKCECHYFVLTVPYLNQSRIGLHQMRIQNSKMKFNPETTHIFELKPEDWNLIFQFSGWKIIKSFKYTQYPKHNPLSICRYLWRKYDFDGFYGVILEKDNSISKLYTD